MDVRSDRRLESDLFDPGRGREKHRIYRNRVTSVIILLCSGVFLGGLRISDVDLDGLIWRAGIFDPTEHICLRSDWVNTTQGKADRVRFCIEWIDLSDQTGETHKVVLEQLEVIKGADGKIRTHLNRGINYRLVIVSVFLVMIILGGVWVQRFLIHRHRRHMELTE